MKSIWQLILGLLLGGLACGPLLAQPSMQNFDNLRPTTLVNGCSNLRVISQSADKTEAVFSMDYTYNGMGGASAKLLPVMEKKGQTGIAHWFGADPVSVAAGKGIISFKVKFFNDEAGVPAEFTTDRIVIYFLNAGGRTVLGRSFFLKTVPWGSPGAKPAGANAATNPSDPENPARLKAEDQAAQKLAEQKRLIEERNAAKEKERQAALLQAEAEEKARREAEAKAKIEAEEREQKRQQAEQDLKRMAEEQRQAQAKAQAELEAKEKARKEAELKQEEARLQAEAEARRVAEAKRLADEQAKAQAAALEEARKKAEAEAQAEVRRKAEEELKRLAEEQRQAQAKAQAELEAKEKARKEAELKQAEARLQAEAEAQRVAEAKRLADEQAKAQAAALEEARLKAEAAEKARKAAEAKAKEEADAREQARTKAEKEAQRLAAEQKFAEEKARQEAAARQAAQAKAEAQARRMAEEKAKAPTPVPNAVVTASATTGPLKTKITNVDVVNRSLDRTKMTIGIEFDYQDSLDKPQLGIDVARTGEPEATKYFESAPMEIGKSKRNFVLVPITFNPPPTLAPALANYSTDKLLIYLQEKAQKIDLFSASILLMWRAPGALAAAAATVPAAAADQIEFDEIKQSDLYSGYATVRYSLGAGPGRLRLKIFEAAKPGSTNYFKSPLIEVPAGRNAQLLEFAARADAPSPSDTLTADTVEVELLDAKGHVAARVSKPAAMSFARPK